ncbi:collagen-like protein, partial [Pyxidicoccus sp. 3LG]
GTAGLNSVAATTAEPMGANCPTGGARLQFGTDANGNGVLDAGEVNAALTRYVCNGAQGPQGIQGPAGPVGPAGPQGTAGLNSVAATTAEPMGA